MLSNNIINELGQNHKQKKKYIAVYPTAGRPPKSCDQCRKHKRACDGGLPKCSLCIIRTKNCTYEYRSNRISDDLVAYTLSKEMNYSKNLNKPINCTVKNMQLSIKHNTIKKRNQPLIQKSSFNNIGIGNHLFRTSTKNLFNIFVSWKHELPNFIKFFSITESCLNLNMLKRIDLTVETETLLRNQLVSTFFSNIHPYYVVIDKKLFRYQYQKGNWSTSFQFLVKVIQYITLAFHFSVDDLPICYTNLPQEVLFYIKRIYLKPTIHTVQALCLLCLQTDFNFKKNLNISAEFCANLAFKHAVALGINRTFMNKKLGWFKVLWEALGNVDQLLMYCSGHALMNSYDDPPIHLILNVSLQYNNDKISMYNHYVFIYSKLLTKLSTLKNFVSNRISHNCTKEQLIFELKRLENALQYWFKSYFLIHTDGDWVMLPPDPSHDKLDLQQYLNYYFALHELNLIISKFDPNQNSSILPFSIDYNINKPKSIYFSEYQKLTANQRCVFSAYLGCYTIMSQMKIDKFIFEGSAFKWFIAIQMLFTLLAFLKVHPTHSLSQFGKKYILFLLGCIQIAKNRFSAFKDFEALAKQAMSLV